LIQKVEDAPVIISTDTGIQTSYSISLSLVRQRQIGGQRNDFERFNRS
jgi:hypothetical protein